MRISALVKPWKLFLVGALLSFGAAAVQAAAEVNRIAVTVDDLDVNADDTPRLNLDQRNDAILETLRRAKLEAAVFVCGMRVDNETGRRHLETWSNGGHVIANHTYSHLDYMQTDFEKFSKDVLHGEQVIRGYAGFTKLLRFPYLREGDTSEKRDRMRDFMKEKEYRHGYVTVDNSDWAIDARMRKRLKGEPNADLSKYRDFYIEHILDRIDYYDSLGRAVLHRPVKHTLLIHHNLLAALYLEDLLAALRARGWQLIDASEAFDDPVFSEAPNIVPAGQSVLWGLARQANPPVAQLRSPGEDRTYEDERMDELGL